MKTLPLLQPNFHISLYSLMVTTAILILAFQDPEAMEARIEEACTVGLGPIYVSIDGTEGSNYSEEALSRNRRCVELACNFYAKKIISHLKISDRNLGQAIAIPSAITWFFSMEQAGLIIEEDCSLISSESLKQALKLFPEIMERTEIIAICLNNLWPENLQSNVIADVDHNFILTNFFNSWGWYTNKSSWQNFDQSRDEMQIVWKGIRKTRISLISKLILLIEWRNHIIRSRKKGKQTWALGFTLHALYSGRYIAVGRQNFVEHQPRPFSEHVKQRPVWAVSSTRNSGIDYELLGFQKVSRSLETYTAKNIHGASVMRFCRGAMLNFLSMLNVVKR
jgi:hypothetical protein